MRGPHAKARHDGLELPARFRHPKTGLEVEIDDFGVAALQDGMPSDWRDFDDMHERGSLVRCWTHVDEIGVLRRHGWIRVPIAWEVPWERRSQRSRCR